ncbi:MAG: Gfo/Idh/MocA family oxidoreductase [Flectobacillus sp.]|nr:Gfo/Idh/MocA family oxidoreductase [Flectobacillus sp.]
MINLILIGCGPHAKRVYLPAIQKISGVKVSLVVELESQKSITENTLKNFTGCEILYTESFQNDVPTLLANAMEEHVCKNRVDGVIIATEPLVHKAYAKWAISQGLNILLDKPITTRENVVSDINQAKGVLQDYEELLTKYQSLQNTKNTVFMISSQRRFHKGFQFVIDKIKEVAAITNCPINFIQAYHSDGQWRFPSEIMSQTYHPYCYGYGKASHSGYHIFDIALEFYKASTCPKKQATDFDVYSSFLQPNGFFEQFDKDDYDELFKAHIDHKECWNTDKIYDQCKEFGELDLSSIITLKKKGVSIANININLVHNGFAGRTWIKPGDDLYKGNGRIKHESYHIQQGPFQSIQIHAYQGCDKHDIDSGLEDYLGGKNHFDVHLFRNPLISDGKPQPSVYKLIDLFDRPDKDSESNIMMEQVKFKVVEEFVDFIEGRIKKKDVTSKIEDHRMSVQIMSGVYCSHILAKEGEKPIVNYSIDKSG